MSVRFVAERLRTLPPYLFARIDALRAEAWARGVDVIDLGVGDPDLPTPPHVVEALARAARDPATHRYPSYRGGEPLRRAAAAFMGRRHGVALDPAREVCALIGSKEGIAHLPLAVCDPGDVVLVPDPAYPVYAAGARFAGAEAFPMPLRRERGFLPDLAAVPSEVARRARLVWINYPNNPTAACAPRAFLAEVVEFARAWDLAIASDLAYAEMVLEGEPAPSILEIAGARERAIELHSLSKTFNMTGWRVGWACGAPELVGALATVKTNVDSGVFDAVQAAAVAALEGPWDAVEATRATYRRRRDVLCDGLAAAGWDVVRPRATFYVLVACPPGATSIGLAERMLAEAGVVATPAVGFGAAGEGYVRLTLCAPEARLREAVERLGRLRHGWMEG